MRNSLYKVTRQLCASSFFCKKTIICCGKVCKRYTRNWINEKLREDREYLVKIRHGANFYKCRIVYKEDNTALVTLNKPDKGIAPGQFAVFYDGEVCLGGGVILV